MQGHQAEPLLPCQQAFEHHRTLHDRACNAAPARSWASYFRGKNAQAVPGVPQATKLSPEDDPDTIHIFTVASGHMYERLQKIMVLSVLRTTRWG